MSLDAVGLVCLDPQKTAAFFKVLGVDIHRYNDTDHWEGATPSGVRIMLDSVQLMKQINPAYQEPLNNSMILGFKQNHPSQVDDVIKILKEKGFNDIVKEPWDAFWGQRYATVREPSGHQIDIFAEL